MSRFVRKTGAKHSPLGLGLFGRFEIDAKRVMSNYIGDRFNLAACAEKFNECANHISVRILIFLEDIRVTFSLPRRRDFWVRGDGAVKGVGPKVIECGKKLAA